MGQTFDATWRQDASTDFAVKQWDAFNEPSETTCKIWCYLPYRWPRYYTLKCSLTRHTDTRIQTDIQGHLNTSQPLRGEVIRIVTIRLKGEHYVYSQDTNILFWKCSWRTFLLHHECVMLPTTLSIMLHIIRYKYEVFNSFTCINISVFSDDTNSSLRIRNLNSS